MAKFLTRDVILAAQGFKTEEIEVPEWGGSVLVRALSAVEVSSVGLGIIATDESSDRLTITSKEGNTIDIAKAIDLYPKIVAYALVDGEGNQLLSEKDARSLSMASQDAMQRIVNVALRLSGLTADDEDEEDSAKNA